MQRSYYDFSKPSLTITQASVKYGIDVSYINGLVKKGIIETIVGSKKLNRSSIGILEFLQKNSEYKSRIYALSPTWWKDYRPQSLSYLCYHDLFDKLSWLVKLIYNDKEQIKKRKYRLNLIFGNFIKSNYIHSKNPILSGEINEADVIKHLSKGWYDELSCTTPIDEDYFNVGSSFKYNLSDQTYFPWVIIQAYYSFFDFTNSLVLLDGPLSNSNKEHHFYQNILNNNLVGKYKDKLMFYPFTLTSQSKNSSLTAFPQHCKFKYAKYLRDEKEGVVELENDVINFLKSYDGVTKGNSKSLTDIFYDFRVWANYTGIDVILDIQNGYLIQHLIKNIRLILYFWAGMVELDVLKVVGEERLVEALKMLNKQFISNNQYLHKNRFYVPVFIRFRIYKDMGLINSRLDFLRQKIYDPFTNKSV